MDKPTLGLGLEFELFSLAVLIGFALGAVYDIFRMIRIVFRQGRVLTFFCDLVYILLFWFTLFTFCTGLTGQIRIFVLAGMLIGCLMERFCIGDRAVRVFRRIMDVISRKLLTPLYGFIAKRGGENSAGFVKNSLKSQRDEKNRKKHLKVWF